MCHKPVADYTTGETDRHPGGGAIWAGPAIGSGERPAGEVNYRAMRVAVTPPKSIAEANRSEHGSTNLKDLDDF